MKVKYWPLDTGFFPVSVELCFNVDSFHKVMKDYGIPLRVQPLEGGIAETHTFELSGVALIVLIIDLEECAEDASKLAGVVAHECCHVVHSILQIIGEDISEFGDESRAYLTQHLVEQTFQKCLDEVIGAKRKEDRTAASKKGKGKGGPVPEVDKPGDDGGARPVGDLPRQDHPSGAEGPKGGIIPSPKVHAAGTAATRNRGARTVVGSYGRYLH